MCFQYINLHFIRNKNNKIYMYEIFVYESMFCNEHGDFSVRLSKSVVFNKDSLFMESPGLMINYFALYK